MYGAFKDMKQHMYTEIMAYVALKLGNCGDNGSEVKIPINPPPFSLKKETKFRMGL